MSFDPTSIPQLPYTGAKGYRTFATRTSNALSPRFVPVEIDWSTYYAVQASSALAIGIDFSGGVAQGGLLDIVQTIKIDNTNANVGVSVIAVDSGDVVSCPPQASVTLPIMTSGLQFWIVAEGLSAGNLPTSKIYFANVCIIPSVDPQFQINFPQYIGSQTIQRNQSTILTSGYGPPALGDQILMDTIPLASSLTWTTILATPKPSGFFYFTGMQAYVLGSTTAVGSTGVFAMRSTGASGQLFNLQFYMPSSPSPALRILDVQGGMNLKLNAQETWQVAAGVDTGGSGSVQYLFTYSYNTNN